MQKLIIQVLVGYMYKVLKNGRNISKFQREFAAIRHGDYEVFLRLVGHEVEHIVYYSKGVISKETTITEDDCDFARLIKSGKSLRIFYLLCSKEFGKIKDKNFSNQVFEELALFELSLRMFRNKDLPRESRITLEKIIDEIQKIMQLTDEETDLLHNGRKFLNNVKRPEKMKDNWKTGLKEFEKAYSVLIENKLIIMQDVRRKAS